MDHKKGFQNVASKVVEGDSRAMATSKFKLHVNEAAIQYAQVYVQFIDW